MLNSFAAKLTIMPGMLAAIMHGTCIIVSSNFAAMWISHLCNNIFPERVGHLLTICNAFAYITDCESQGEYKDGKQTTNKIKLINHFQIY